VAVLSGKGQYVCGKRTGGIIERGRGKYLVAVPSLDGRRVKGDFDHTMREGEKAALYSPSLVLVDRFSPRN